MASPEQVRYFHCPKVRGVDSLIPKGAGRITEHGVETPKLSPNGRKPRPAPVIPEINILATPETEGPTPVDFEELESSGLPSELMRENPEEGTTSDIDDNTKLYLREIGRYPLLTQPDEIRLAQVIERSRIAKDKLKDPLLLQAEREKYEEEIKAGKSARETLTNSNLRLVVSVARRYRTNNLSFLDLIQEGNIGLMNAVDKFDWRRGFRFSTYGTWWIRQAITRAIDDKEKIIRIPVHMATIINGLKITRARIFEETGREPTIEELARETGSSVKRVKRIIEATKDPISLQTSVGDENEEDGCLGDFIRDERADSAEEAVNLLLKEDVGTVLNTLTEREKRVLELRFGWDDGTPKTLEEVGKEFNLTREGIRQIEEKALRKLRHPSISNKLRGFL